VGSEDTEAILTFLRDRGAGELPHARGRSLLEHLTETAAILGRWHQPEWLRRAALLHSVYGTDAYRRRLLGESDRDAVVELAGPRAERLAHLFARTPRRGLLAGTHRWAPGVLGDPAPTRAELDALVVLHMANLAEQSAAPDGSPGRWLAELGRLAGHVIDSETITLPSVFAALLHLTAADEERARTAYRAGVATGDREQLALAAASSPVVAEPCIHLGWGELARERLTALGVAWDKRRTYEEWLGLATAGAPPAQRPRASGRARFLTYLDGLSAGERAYPGLRAQPWHDVAGFPLARALEAQAGAIAGEIGALTSFQREAEPIARTGDWDVAFFFERGRRDEAACAACPSTARVIDADTVMRTSAGLVYASRLAPGTHIAPHRGPTNIRLRCHLAITVPEEGDCAIRVGAETRRWEAGRAIVFDDSFDHEAWNHSDTERIVLVVDLWHPDLSPEEIRLLTSLHGQAARLAGYWRANERARAD
jgi:hypothetical protein